MDALRRMMLVMLGLTAGIVIAGCTADSDNSSKTPGQDASCQLLDADGVPLTPDWVGFRDGTGPWTQLTAPDANQVWRHRVDDPAGRYTFAVVENNQTLRLYAGTLGELKRFSDLTLQASVSSATLYLGGTVTGVPESNAWSAAAGSRRTTMRAGSETTFQLGIRPPGSIDLLALRASGVADTAARNMFWMLRGIPVATNVTQGIDFTDLTRADPGTPRKVAVAGGALTTGRVSYATATTVITSSWWQTPAGTLAELWYLSPSAAQQRPEDTQCAWGRTSSLSRIACAAAASPLALDFSGLPEFGGVSLAGRTFSWSAYPGAQLYEIPVRPATGLAVALKVTPGAAGASPSITIPNVSDLPGWNPEWTVTTDTVSPITATALGSNTPLDLMLQQKASNRYAAGYSGWTAIGAPFVQGEVLGQGEHLRSQCQICLSNCIFAIDLFACETECDLVC